MNETITIAGIPVTNTTLHALVKDIETYLTSTSALPPSRRIQSVLTVNPEIVIQASHTPFLKEILGSAWRTIADGVGITVASRLHGKPFKMRITGVELTRFLLMLAQEKGWTVGVVGGTPASHGNTALFLQNSFPTLPSWSMTGPWIGEERYEQYAKQLDLWLHTETGRTFCSNLARTSILFVAMGAPKQEFFIHYLQTMPRGQQPNTAHRVVAVAVGGTFDELAGSVPAAPSFVGSFGLKWLFRLTTQPWRWKRQLRLLEYIPRTLSPRFINRS